MNFEAKSRLLDRFFAAIEAGEIEAVRALYAPDAGIWHNFDGVTQGVEDNLRTLRWVCKNVSGRRYDEIRRAGLDDGRVLQQHVLRGIAPNGEELAISACIITSFAGERISRVEEYLDSAQVAVLQL